MTVRNLTGTELKRLHRDWRRRTEGRLALLLDGVQTPYNVGAILRTRRGLPGRPPVAGGADRVPRAPEDAEDRARLAALRDLDRLRRRRRGRRRRWPRPATPWSASSWPKAPDPSTSSTWPPDVCLAVGHEDRGLSKACLARCDEVGYLPQLGPIGSLNVATAASIAMYEVRRRAWTA